MNRSYKRVLSLSLFLLVGISIVFSVVSAKPINTPYQYPITPGSIEWEGFESRLDMIDACQIPKHILDKLSTSALLQTVLTYPFLSEMTMFYRTPEECEQEIGFWHIANSFNGLQELIMREDALLELKNYGSFNNLDNNDSVLTIIYRNILGSQTM